MFKWKATRPKENVTSLWKRLKKKLPIIGLYNEIW